MMACAILVLALFSLPVSISAQGNVSANPQASTSSAPRKEVSKSEAKKVRKFLKDSLPSLYHPWVKRAEIRMTFEEAQTFVRNHGAFLESVQWLMSRGYFEDFLELGEVERDHYKDVTFWSLVSANDPTTTPDGFRRDYLERAAFARQVFGKLGDDRARTLLVRGVPSGLVYWNVNRPWASVGIDQRKQCAPFNPIEVWFYPPRSQMAMAQPFVFVFYAPGVESSLWRLWRPTGGTGLTADDLRPLLRPAGEGTAERSGGDNDSGTIQGMRQQGFELHCNDINDILGTLMAAKNTLGFSGEREQELLGSPAMQESEGIVEDSTAVPSDAVPLTAKLSSVHGVRDPKYGRTSGDPRIALLASELAANLDGSMSVRLVYDLYMEKTDDRGELRWKLKDESTEGTTSPSQISSFVPGDVDEEGFVIAVLPISNLVTGNYKLVIKIEDENAAKRGEVRATQISPEFKVKALGEDPQ